MTMKSGFFRSEELNKYSKKAFNCKKGLLLDALKSRKGFSLIELIIAICIMSVLLGLLIPNFAKFVRSNKEDTCRHNREAILEVYARCVLDSSIDHATTMPYKTEGLKKVIPDSTGAVTFAPVKTEVFEYRYCPVSNSPYSTSNCGVDETTHTAWIECPDCGNVVSIDITAVGNRALSTPAPDVLMTPDPSTSPSISPGATPGLWTVSFNLNGHALDKIGSFPDQQVEDGGTPLKPSVDPTDAIYEFKNWYKDASGSELFDFGAAIYADTVVYACWKPYDADRWWPYADNASWWNWDTATSAYHDRLQEAKANAGEVGFIYLIAPSGKFVSRNGGIFVYLGQNTNGSGQERGLEISKANAASPEYFAASGSNSQTLAQLTGRSITVDISKSQRDKYIEQIKDNGGNPINVDFVKIEKTGNDVKYTINNLSPGDEIVFLDGATQHIYVAWHSAVETTTVIEGSKFDNIINNYNKVGNLYREGP